MRLSLLPLLQYETGLLGKKWQPRWVVLVPNGLLVFKSTAAPKQGTPAGKAIVIEGGLWEGADPVEAKRSNVLSFAQDGEVRVCMSVRVLILVFFVI